MELGWIDFSKEDRQKAFDVINLLSEPGAVDELGIGIVRDAFSNYFFPGTSTIQTRAKYFLIISYLLKEAIEGAYGKDVNQILRDIDLKEKKCALQLLANNPDAEGIIGKRVLPNGWVARKPSDIYWSGIRTYGIFKDSLLTIPEYINISLKLKEQKNNMKVGNRGDDTAETDRDDIDAGDNNKIHLWDLPIYKNDWDNGLSIDLTLEEANFLSKQIQKTVPNSLLAYILKEHIDLEKYDGFNSLAMDLSNKVNDDLSYMMKLACDFNELIYMARVRYNIILSEGRNEVALREWDILATDCKQRANADLIAIFESLRLINPKTFVFLKKIQEAFLNEDFELVDNIIRKREIQLKGVNRAKLNRTSEYDPSRWIGGGWLDYRFTNAKRIINDIYYGEGISYV